MSRVTADLGLSESSDGSVSDVAAQMPPVRIRIKNCRSIDDIALYRDVLLDVKPVPVAKEVSPPRIGFCRTHLWSLLEP